MEKRVATIPDFNINEQIEAISQTAGAYTGAVVTAAVGGLMTGLTSLFRGAVEGAKVTYSNAGHQQAVVENTSAARKMGANAGTLNSLTEEDLQELLRIKQARQLAGATNGNSNNFDLKVGH